MEIFYILGAILLILLLACICFHSYVTLFIVAITGKKRMQRKLYKGCKVNDFLTISDLYVPTDENKTNHIDTIIYANKYIYIITQLAQAGEIKTSLDDNMWRVVYDKKMTTIRNPLLHNRKVISKLVTTVPNLEESDMKSIVVVSKTCTLANNINTDKEFVVSENKAIQLILDIEKNSNEDIIDPYEIERYAKAFYEYGLKTEKLIKEKKGK